MTQDEPRREAIVGEIPTDCAETTTLADETPDGENLGYWLALQNVRPKLGRASWLAGVNWVQVLNKKTSYETLVGSCSVVSNLSKQESFILLF